MLKTLTTFLCTFVLGFSMVFGAAQDGPFSGGPPPRQDQLDYTSPSAKTQLKRAEYILSTLVPDPQSYQLILSSMTSFGGEAFAPNVYSNKPTIIIYQGALAPNHSNDELAFMMAHELGHLNMYHNENMAQQMEKIYNGPPIGITGTIFTVFYQKLQERQADLYGLKLYKQSGYNMGFFAYMLNQMNTNPRNSQIANKFPKLPTSMSMKDTHFSMKERFTLLTQEAQHA